VPAARDWSGKGLLDRRVAAADVMTSLSRKKNPSQVAQAETPTPEGVLARHARKASVARAGWQGSALAEIEIAESPVATNVAPRASAATNVRHPGAECSPGCASAPSPGALDDLREPG